MSSAIDTARLLPGFADQVLESQEVFRGMLSALAYPGRIVPLHAPGEAPAPLHPATAAICLALADFDTPVWCDDNANLAVSYLRFHCGVPFVERYGEARFAIVTDPQSMPSLTKYCQGSDQFPDRSATVVIQLPSLRGGSIIRLSGPGIAKVAELRAAGIPDAFWAQRAMQHEIYPLGVDVILVCGREIVGLPRTTRMEL